MSAAVRRGKITRSSTALLVLVGAVVATSGTAAAVLTGAIGASTTPRVQVASNAGCPDRGSATTTRSAAQAVGGRTGPLDTELAATVAPGPVNTPGGVPIVFTTLYPSAGYPQGGTRVTVTGSGFGNYGNPNIWALFDFGYDASGNGILVTVEASVVNDTTMIIPSTPAEENGVANPAVYLATPDSWVLTTTAFHWKLFNVIGPKYFTYTNNPPPTTTSTFPPTTTTFPPPISVTTVPVNYLPIINALDPPVGNPAGGTAVSIVGTNLNGATSVTFGGAKALSFTVLSSGLISAVAPPGGVGKNVQVQVTTSVGSSQKSQAASFTYTTALPALRHAGCTTTTTG